MVRVIKNASNIAPYKRKRKIKMKKKKILIGDILEFGLNHYMTNSWPPEMTTVRAKNGYFDRGLETQIYHSWS